MECVLKMLPDKEVKTAARQARIKNVALKQDLLHML